MKISVLGQEYKIRHLNFKEYPKLELLEANGLFEGFSKEIIINSDMDKSTGKEYANFEKFKSKVLRHEIIHAYFHESGMQEYCCDERLVDFLSYQLPKIFKTMIEAEAIE